jgi:hypothetical protein
MYGYGAGEVGVRGESNAEGVRGLGGSYGVHGIGVAPGYVGVYGEGSTVGVSGAGSTGVKGMGSAGGIGVSGEETSGNGIGVKGYGYTGVRATARFATVGYGIYADGGDYAGYFNGDVHVHGTLSKSGGSFKIDHPLDPENKYLSHSFVESPDMKNIYDGVVELDSRGEAIVVLPEWFSALNKDYRYQLTCIGEYAPVYISEEIDNSQFAIAGGLPGLKVSWQVTGIRQDPWAEKYRIPVEENKEEWAKGKYLNPDVYDMPDEMSIHYTPGHAE